MALRPDMPQQASCPFKYPFQNRFAGAAVVAPWLHAFALDAGGLPPALFLLAAGKARFALSIFPERIFSPAGLPDRRTRVSWSVLAVSPSRRAPPDRG